MKFLFRVFLAFLFVFILSCSKDKDYVTTHKWNITSLTLENGEVLTPDSLNPYNYEYLFYLRDRKRYKLELNGYPVSGEVFFGNKKVTFKSINGFTLYNVYNDFSTAIIDNIARSSNWYVIDNKLFFENKNGLKINFIKK
jgi:hypothetical protein